MKAIDTEKTLAKTWLAAAQYLRLQPHQEVFDLVLEIETPAVVDERDRHIQSVVDRHFREHQMHPLFTVAETIFPGWQYKKHGLKGVYEIYPDEIIKVLNEEKHPDRSWGTYAHRMLRRAGKNGNVYNPLKDCIEKMKTQMGTPGPKRNCYEIGMLDDDLFGVGFDMPLYDGTHDRRRSMSGPCLSHISIKLTREKQVRLTALYRLHYYVAKALGNLLGLARLQHFIADQLGIGVGPLVCHSTLARLDTESIALRTVDNLLQELQAAP